MDILNVKLIVRLCAWAWVASVSMMVASGSVMAASGVINDPVQFEWTYHPVTAGNPEAYYSGTLEYGKAEFTFGTDNLVTRAYRQAGKEYSIPAPTLTMKPGNKYVLTYKNLLPFTEHDETHNVKKDPDIGNLHTHGLHISGESPSDDVTRMFEGTKAGEYVYDIALEHMGGTYWYHNHHHGSTYLQVSSGGFGMIVIEDSPADLTAIPVNVSLMEEKQLVIAFLDPSVAGAGGDTLISGTLETVWTVNGEIITGEFNTPHVAMPRDTWQHWRISLIDNRASNYDLSIGPDSAQCEVLLLARDGVWRTTVPGVLATTNTVSMTGASRADLAVRCFTDATISVGNKAVAYVVVGEKDAAAADAHPYAEDGVSQWASYRPSYLRDLRSSLGPVNYTSVNMGARAINGKSYDALVPTQTFTPDAIQEINLKGAGNHPFHMHINHVQVQNAGGCGDFEEGEFYDVIAKACLLRFDLRSEVSTVYDGKMIMHCHIIDHEDLGAMGWFDILTGTNTIGFPTFPIDGDRGSNYRAYYDFNTAVNTAPIAGIGVLAATRDSVAKGIMTATDNENDTLTYNVIMAPAHGVVMIINSSTGEYAYTPVAGFSGTDRFSFRVTDTGGYLSATAVISITVGVAPVASDGDLLVIEDSVANAGSLSASDVDGDTLRFSITSMASNGTVILGVDNNYTYAPYADFYGTDQFSFVANDGAVDSNIATIVITVENINDAPVAIDSSLRVTPDSIDNAGLLVASDIDGDTLSYSIESTSVNGTLILAADNNYTYTPNAGFVGTDSFTFKVVDASLVDSNVATVSIEVAEPALNTAPVASDDSVVVSEDSADNAGVLIVADTEGDSLSYSILTTAVNGWVTMGVDNSYTYTPNANFNGSDSFSFIANDGSLDSNIATITITVQSVNDAPVASDDLLVVDQDSIDNTGALIAKDIDGDALTFRVMVAASNGTVTFSEGNVCIYTPNAGFYGADSFTFRANDGAVDSNTATISITVNQIAPLAPEGLSASSSTIKVKSSVTYYHDLVWTAPTNASGYRIFSAVSNDGPWMDTGVVVLAPTVAYQFSFSSNPDVMYYTVQAVNGAGVSDYSNWAGSDGSLLTTSTGDSSPLLVAPENLEASLAKNGKNVSLSWTMIDPVDSFNIYRSETSGSYDAVYSTEDGGSTSWNDSNVPAGTYYYVIRAVVNGSESDVSNEAVIIVP